MRADTRAASRAATHSAWLAPLIVCALLVPAAAPAGGESGGLVEDSVHPLAPPDTSSPRATLRTFLHEARQAWRVFLAGGGDRRQTYEDAEAHLSRAGRCLDLTEIPPGAVRETADETVLLLDVLERIPVPGWSQIPDASAAKLEELEQWRIPNTEIAIARVKAGPRRGEWLFSPETVARAKEFYERTDHLPYKADVVMPGAYRTFSTLPGWWVPLASIEALPVWARRVTLGQAVWQWIGLLLAIGAAILIVAGVRAWARRRASDAGARTRLRQVAVPLAAIVLLLIVRDSVLDQLGISGIAFGVARLGSSTGAYLFGAWAVILLGRALADAVVSSPRIHPQSVDAHLLRVAAQVVGIALAVLLVVQAASTLGVPVVGIVAGLGVGGLAVALAAQSTLENFIGSITIFADRPVRIGEFCRFGDEVGTVEQIGLRSTRIRTLGRSVVTIPNAEFSRIRLDNFSRRDMMLLRTTLALRYETTPEQLRRALELLQKLLAEDPRVVDDPLRVQLIELGPHAFEVELFAYVDTRDWAEFLAIRSELLLGMIDAVAEAGTGLAAPARTVYMGRGAFGPSDTEPSSA